MARTLVDWRDAAATTEPRNGRWRNLSPRQRGHRLIKQADRMSRELRAGTVWVNSFDQADISAPFGGFRQSGFGGKDKSLWAIEKYASLKTTWINLGRGRR